jgi:hypothetical protein
MENVAHMISSDEAIVLQAYAKAIPVLKRAIANANGDFRKINFAAAREDWLTMLSPEELTVIVEYEATSTEQADRRRVTSDMTEYLRRLGCWNPPEATPLH